jgi:rhomboid family protein
MFPIRDDNPTFLTPYGTYVIIGLNVAVWALLQGFGTEPTLTRSICTLGLIPGSLLESASVSEAGNAAFCLVGNTGGWYTPLTAMFMHGSWFHILGNMWFLWVFGDNVEDAMGTVRFVFFYVLSGLAAAALQIVADPASPIPMVGASGAIGGVMGAYVLLYPRVHVHMLIFLGFFVTTVAVPAVFMLGYWFIVQLLQGVASANVNSGGGVAFWAHVGGFVTGAALIYVFRKPELLARHPYHGWGRGSTSQPWRRIGR